MGFKLFYIFRGNEDLRKLTVCSVLKRKIIFRGLAEEHTSMSEHFLHSDSVVSTYSSKNLTLILRYCIRIEQVESKPQKSQNKMQPKPAYFPPVLVKLPHIAALQEVPVTRAY